MPCRKQLPFNLVPTLLTLRNVLCSPDREDHPFIFSFIHLLIRSFNQSLLSIYYVPAPVLDTGGTAENSTKSLPIQSSHSSDNNINKCSVSTGFALDTILNARHGPHVILQTSLGRYYVYLILQVRRLRQRGTVSNCPWRRQDSNPLKCNDTLPPKLREHC